jgi:hypothetical protein
VTVFVVNRGHLLFWAHHLVPSIDTGTSTSEVMFVGDVDGRQKFPNLIHSQAIGIYLLLGARQGQIWLVHLANCSSIKVYVHTYIHAYIHICIHT